MACRGESAQCQSCSIGYFSTKAKGQVPTSNARTQARQPTGFLSWKKKHIPTRPDISQQRSVSNFLPSLIDLITTGDGDH
ncbi:hypothetical protein UPYG_G00206070 [Umbra pygmaea]|uniref:Uncharacterized protein n=1 Tax=Umbra pygmaea TaxID=75934 RepID=A0ABD0WKQ1_UMBPY